MGRVCGRMKCVELIAFFGDPQPSASFPIQTLSSVQPFKKKKKKKEMCPGNVPSQNGTSQLTFEHSMPL